MTQEEWLAEVRRRIGINEGCRLSMYHDSQGVPTIGYGFNLNRADARAVLARAGVLDPALVIAGNASITQTQADAIFDAILPGIISEARASVTGFDELSDARRFVIVDLVFNLGYQGWCEFGATRWLIEQGIKAHADPAKAHGYFGQAADHLQDSPWFSQVGNRARRDCAMMRSSLWVDPLGDGA